MVEYECPPTLHFNAVFQVCDFAENAGCKTVDEIGEALEDDEQT